MKQRHWREMVEIIGVICIVASILLLASEVRQANQITRSDIELRIADMHNRHNLELAHHQAFAKLLAKTRNPESHLLTATDLAQIDGLAAHNLNAYLIAQTAFYRGLIDDNALNNYKSELEKTLQSNPALAQEYVEILERSQSLQGHEVFTPIAEHAEKKPPEPTE